MQDTRTGEMHQLERLEQDEYDRVIADKTRQGVILTVGERVDIKGGVFKIKSIGRKMIVLEGMPGTWMGE